MGITVTRAFDVPLDQIELVTAEDMREIGLLARERIVRRTMAGVDANGAAFASYSPQYAKQKAAALGTAAVNLQVSGNMLNDITIVDVKGWTETDGHPSVSLGFTK